MPAAPIIAQIMGPVFVIVAVGMAVNADAYRRMGSDVLASPAQRYVGGILAAVTGALILAFHDTWTAEWTTVITVLAWVSLIKGVVLIVFPDHVAGLFTPLLTKTSAVRLGAVAPLILGLFLCGKGFGLI